MASVATSLGAAEEGALIEFLRERSEMFAWHPADMPSVPKELPEHALNIYHRVRRVAQSLRRFSWPKRKAILKELYRLQDAKFISETVDTTWVANPVLVPKKIPTKSACALILHISINNTQKDHFPTLRIDQIIDAIAGYECLSFLDAYSGYHQISLKEDDQDKTAFIMPYGLYYYQAIPFGLKNAGATYQRMMQKCLKEQIGKSIQV
jgi:hypothetical protein